MAWQASSCTTTYSSSSAVPSLFQSLDSTVATLSEYDDDNDDDDDDDDDDGDEDGDDDEQNEGSSQVGPPMFSNICRECAFL